MGAPGLADAGAAVRVLLEELGVDIHQSSFQHWQLVLGFSLVP